MKLEAVTPFLGKYRPFVGRCCQTCTPKSWVSDGQARPPLGKPGAGSHSCLGPGKQLPLFSRAQPFPAPVVSQGGGALVFVGLGLAPGSWLPGLGGLGGEVQRDPRCQRAGV